MILEKQLMKKEESNSVIYFFLFICCGHIFCYYFIYFFFGYLLLFYRELIDYAIRTIKPAFDALPDDCTIGVHICRGNGEIKWVV
jgi:hypothetical protein